MRTLKFLALPTTRLVRAALLTVACLRVLSSCTSGGSAGGFPINVVVSPAEEREIPELARSVATLAADETIEIRSEIDGTVKEILFAEGELVPAGKELIRFDDARLSALYREAEAAHRLAEANFKRGRSLSESGTISRQEFDQLRSQHDAAAAALARMQDEFEDTIIRAPFAGVVSARSVSPGQFVRKDAVITSLSRLDPIKVELTLPERFVSKLTAELPVSITLPSLPERSFQGKTFFISPLIDPRTRTVMVKAQIANPGGELRPGMLGEGSITLATRRAVAVPENALLRRAQSLAVMIADKESTAELREVQIGYRGAGFVEIISGVIAGEEVIIEGLQKARPGAKLLTRRG